MDGTMNGYALTAVIIQSIASLAWPAAIVASVYLFRSQLAELLPRLQIKHGESEVSFSRIGKLIEKVQEHEATRVQSIDLPPPSTSVTNLSSLSDDALRLKVEDTALKMREMESRFKSEDLKFQTRFRVRANWEDETEQLLASSDRRRHEWQTTLLPDAVALRDELIRRLGTEIEVDTQRSNFVFHGMLAGPYPLNEAALTLERLARNLTGPTVPVLAPV